MVLGEIDPTALGTWILIGAFVAMTLAGVWRAVIASRPHPPLEEQFVSRREFNQFREEVTRTLGKLEGKMDAGFNRISTQIEQQLGTANLAGERRAIALHERINPLERTSARHEAEIDNLKATALTNHS